MKTGIVGLGLIGASMAKAYKKELHTVYGADIDQVTLGYAVLSGIADGKLDESTIVECELILLAVPPYSAADWLSANSQFIAKDTLVIDLCGTKRAVCETGFALAEKYGYIFVGGHPMAGTHKAGIKNSTENLFRGQPMVIVPHEHDNIALYNRIVKLLEPADFGHFSFTTAEEHDRVIAYTSQLAHVVSNAYVKSPAAYSHSGMSAGSYQDMTRVARMNESMWTELFMENRDNLINEIDILMKSLSEYRDALANDDGEQLCKILADGSAAKTNIDGPLEK